MNAMGVSASGITSVIPYGSNRFMLVKDLIRTAQRHLEPSSQVPPYTNWRPCSYTSPSHPCSVEAIGSLLHFC